MAITTKEEGVWILDQVYAKENQGSIWAYDSAGPLFTSGANEYGEGGRNDVVTRSSPVEVPGSTWTNISVSGSTRINAGTKADGTLWTWGRDYAGQAGWNTDGDERSSPVQVTGFPPSSGKVPLYDSGYVGCSILGTSYVDEDGSLWIWGRNEYGQLGHNDRINRSKPVQVPGVWSQNLAYNDDETRFCVKSDGKLYSWGYGNVGQLGQNKDGAGTDGAARSSPTQVPGTGWSTEIGTLSRGPSTTAAVKTDGTLWTWGMGQGGQLGQNEAGQTKYSSPIQVGTATNWKYVQCTGGTLLATKTNGELWTCGWGEYGNLGLNSVVNKSSPTQIPGTTWHKPIDAKKNAAGCTKTDGTLWIWGRNQKGAFGLNSVVQYSSPIQFGSANTWNNNEIQKRMSIAGQYEGGWILDE